MLLAALATAAPKCVITILSATMVALSSGCSTPSPTPTAAPTARPTAVPTLVPTVPPTAVPTSAPSATPLPTATPTIAASASPKPSSTPSPSPTVAPPSAAPTGLVSLDPPCCLTLTTSVDAAGDVIATVTNGGIGAVNLTYTGSALLSHVAVLSGGSLVGGNGGPTAFTSMTSTTEVVEFYVAPPFSPTPVPSGNLSASRCRTVYTSSLICKPLPASPAVAANSAAWAALEFQSGHDNIGGITVSSDPTNPNEGSEPLDQLSPGGPSISTTVRCNKESYSAFTCKAAGVPDGTTITLPAGMYTQKGSDHHCAADIVTLGVEYDGWLCDDPVASPTLNVGGFGVCPWSGDGTGCSGSTATNIATSLGGIDPTELANAEADPIHGSLPYAIAASVLCGDPGFVKPAVSSDGANTNGSSACAGHTASGQRPPEGTRWFLALTDAQINATANLPYVKAILRTMDEQHFGGFISDTNWSGAPGLAVQYRHGSWPGPAAELGVNPNVTPTWTMPITTNGIDLSKVVTFCSNGSC